MDITSISQLIGSLGFPILASCALFYYIQTQQKSHKEEITELTQSISLIETALNNNTLILQKLIDKIEKEN